MAEAAVEGRPPPARFFCHKCNIEFERDVLQVLNKINIQYFPYFTPYLEN